MTTDNQIADTGAPRPSGTPLRPRAANATILCWLWVAVIALAVAIDLAK